MDQYDKVYNSVKRDIENNQELFNQYTLLEMIYEKMHSELTSEKLFPSSWYTEYSYVEKIDILKRAINEKITVYDVLHNRKIYNKSIK